MADLQAGITDPQQKVHRNGAIVMLAQQYGGPMLATSVAEWSPC